MMIYQAKNSSNTGQFEALVEKLQQHGNPVYTRLTPRNMLRFYDEKASQEMMTQFKPLGENTKKIIVNQFRKLKKDFDDDDYSSYIKFAYAEFNCFEKQKLMRLDELFKT